MKFNELLLHPQTKATLIALQKQPPHGLLLVGQDGMGKCATATAWAELVLDQAVPEIRVIAPDERGTISIDTVRTLYAATRSKHEGQRAIIIAHAEAMGSEAQNALLKLLEEPLPGNVLILTAKSTDALLPTIVSRTQVVQVNRISQAASKKLVENLGVADPQHIAQLLFIASGRPAELIRLASDRAYFDKHIKLVQQAKALIEQPVFERLTIIPELAKNREDCLLVLSAMERIIIAGLQRTSQPARPLAIAQNLQIAAERIVQNGNIRAQLLALFTCY